MKVLRQQDIGLERAYNVRPRRIAFNRLNTDPSQRLRREVGYWWCLSHENIIPLLGLAKDEEFGSFGAIISPVCNLVGNKLDSQRSQWYKNGTAYDYFKARGCSISFREKIKLVSPVV